MHNGDVVLFQDNNVVRGEWRKAVVVDAIKSKDNRLRRAVLEYNSDTNMKIRVERPVQRLILMIHIAN